MGISCRRVRLACTVLSLVFGGTAALAAEHTGGPDRPNIVLMMCDDLGWGDVGFNGNEVIRTPHLDEMAAASLKFNRFYAAAPVCSPTRGSCLTGRHPFRYGVYYANVGHLRPEEVTLAELLKDSGYATGHFGKWHLGTLTMDQKDGRRGGAGGAHYSPPWDSGFDVCFSTEMMVPTWNPMQNQPFPTHYWTGSGQIASDNLEGDDSRVLMDRAIPFIERAASDKTPFLAVIWFHAPHAPVVASPEYRKMYDRFPEGRQHYYGCITALDEQVGRLRARLRELGVAETTMVSFCSDNGPEGGELRDNTPGSAGPFRGRKRSLYEGGVRVPALIEWPSRIPQGETTDYPAVTSDLFPTVLELIGADLPDDRPLDGVSLVPMLSERVRERNGTIGFQSGKQRALMDNRHKLISTVDGQTWELYDLLDDPGESRNLAGEQPQIVQQLRLQLAEWMQSCQASDDGRDYE